MSFEILLPIDDATVAHTALLSKQSLGKNINIHSKQHGFPEIEVAHLAIIGVLEDRNTVDNFGSGNDLTEIRKSLYQLYNGNWFANIVDLGNIPKGNEIEDTYFALKEILTTLIKKNIVPL